MPSHRTPALISATGLAARLADPAVVVVDCRFDLMKPDWGAQAWAQSHLPGAAFADLNRDLSSPVTPATGRHPLPEPRQLAAFFGRLGIGPDSYVVGYDQDKPMGGSRLWWLLRWLGHERVSVLDGGLAAWQAAGLPLGTEPPSRAPVTFSVREPLVMAISTAELQQELMQESVTLVDARPADRFAGRNETIDPVPGHIPGARNLPFPGNFDAAGRLLPVAELASRWQAALGGRPPQQVVAMCGSGVTACVNLLALHALGLGGARLYAESWSGWIRDPARPVASGPA